MSTVNLGCRLDLKKIALHARNAEYNPKVGVAGGVVSFGISVCCVEICGSDNEDQRSTDYGTGLQLWEDGVHWSQEVSGIPLSPHLCPPLSLSSFRHSEELSRLAARKYARIIQKLGFPVSHLCVCVVYVQWWSECVCVYVTQARFMEFKIQNMVGSCDVKFPIRLEGLVINQPQFSR